MNNTAVFPRYILSLFLILSGLGHSQTAVASEVDCVAALTNVVHSLVSYPQEAELDHSYEGYRTRFPRFLESIDSETFNSIFHEMSSTELKDLYWLVKLKKLDPVMMARMEATPGIQQFIIDAYRFTRDHPGLLWERSQDVHAAARSALDRAALPVAEQETSTFTVSRLKRNISGALAAVLTRAIGEYKGQKYDRSLGRRTLDRLKRFIFPLYHRVDAVLEHGQLHQKQLDLIAVVDSIVENRGIQRSAELRMSTQEVSALQAFIQDSPTQVRSVEVEMQRVFGQQILHSAGVREDDVRIYELYRNVKEQDLEKIDTDFHKEAEKALEELDTQINAARTRLGMPPRPMQDRMDAELKLRLEEFDRKNHTAYEMYYGATAQNTNLSYSVEDRHTRQVYDGQDSKGNAKYRTETYYTSRTVIPKFENVLSESYDTGDRFVSGLDTIRAQAEAVVAKERPYRAEISEFASYFENFEDNYLSLIADSAKQRTTLQELETRLQNLRQTATELETYKTWSENQIYTQWSSDTVENFRRRNQQLHQRYLTAIKMLEFTHEIVSRRLIGIRFTGDLENYTEALDTLRRYLYINYGIKIAGTLTIGGATFGTYTAPEWPQEFAAFLLYNLEPLLLFFQ